MEIRLHRSLNEITPTQWSGLALHDNPFVSYAFLSALETHHCVGRHAGWEPHFLAAWRETELLGAIPLYLKSNSYGEFVFDWSWADAYRQIGGNYYPKLVVAAPYTPATGPRLLVKPGESRESVVTGLIDAAIGLAHDNQLSSLHWLFPDPGEMPLLKRAGLMERIGMQYHWHNPGYRDFQDYLDAMTAAKRKMVRRERRRVIEQGIEIRRLRGSELDDEQWRTVYALYSEIYQRKWGYATLTEDFFRALGDTLGERMVIVLAYHDRRCVAGAIDFVGGGVLYGRHWGCFEHFDQLHFELCYYQGIEMAIEQGWQRFEPGAQGEHKIARGFLPVKTYSAHWIANPDFRRAVGRFLRAETREMEEVIADLGGHSPFRQIG